MLAGHARSDEELVTLAGRQKVRYVACHEVEGCRYLRPGIGAAGGILAHAGEHMRHGVSGEAHDG